MPRASILNCVELSVIGVDIGKDVFHVVGLNPDGENVLRRKIKGDKMGNAAAGWPPGAGLHLPHQTECRSCSKRSAASAKVVLRKAV